MLEHSWEPLKALQELSRLLKPSGVILITTPFAYPIHEEPYDFCRITPFFIRYWFPKIGLQEPKILELGGNELEVLATVWGNIWKPDERTLLLPRVVLALMRLTMNLAVLGTNPLTKPLLKQSYFLNFGCIAYKETGNSVELSSKEQ